MPPGESKPISAADDSSKRLIMELLQGDMTYGFDVDSIYYIETEAKWLLFEFLKCDHASVRPRDSHPKRYWYNWRKFASLWRLKVRLSAELYLINYEDEAHAKAQKRDAREFVVIHVKAMKPTEDGGITDQTLQAFDAAGLSAWFRAINARGGAR